MKVISKIDRGAFGRVDRVRMPDGSLAARKTFDPSQEVLRWTDESKLRRRFEREAKVQSALDSEFVIPVLDSDLKASASWFVMPLADRNFEEEIKQARAAGQIPTNALADILNALEYLHGLGYVHRDLKPANALLHDGRWKLSDFGLVSPISGATSALTSAFSAWGTAAYCAPEQLQDFKSATAAADIYAFGCMLHDIVDGTQRIPYRQHTAAGPIGYIIEKCTEVTPRRRFKNVTALRGVLLAQLSQQSSLPSTPTVDEWADALDKVESWDAVKLEQFARFLRGAQEDGTGLWAVLNKVDEDVLSSIHKIDPDLWSPIALSYADWARGSFSFEYCDVIVKRLEAIFELGNLQEKASSALSAAHLGCTHNRWFVMGRVMELCGPALEDSVAQRIAIEIEVEEAQEDFIDCARTIRRTIGDFHPHIAARLHPAS